MSVLGNRDTKVLLVIILRHGLVPSTAKRIMGVLVGGGLGQIPPKKCLVAVIIRIRVSMIRVVLSPRRSVSLSLSLSVMGLRGGLSVHKLAIRHPLTVSSLTRRRVIWVVKILLTVGFVCFVRPINDEVCLLLRQFTFQIARNEFFGGLKG